MADVVGLRFVTTGEKEAIAAYDRYKAGLLSLDQVQNKHVAAFNRRANEEVRALQRQDAEARKAFQNRLRYDREKEQAAAQTARAVEQAAQQEARALQRQDAEARKAYQQYLRYQQEKERAAAQAAREIEQAAEREARAHRQAAQETARLAAETQALARAYNPVMAAAAVYEREVQQLNRAQKLGVLTADQLRVKLGQLRMEYGRVGQSAEMASQFTNQFGTGAHLAGIKTNRFGMVAQQVGYQVGDFFVQVQSGANVFVAFGQQATQLAGLLPGVAGAIVGISISLGTMLLAAWDRTRRAQNETAESVSNLREEYEQLTRSLTEYARAQEAAARGFTPEEALSVDVLTEAEAALAAAQERLNALDVDRAYILLNNQRIEVETLDVKIRQKALADAQLEVDQAGKVVADLRNKLNSENLAELERGVSLEARALELMKVEAAYGSDSIQLLRAKNALDYETLENRLKQEAAVAGITTEEKRLMDAILSAVRQQHEMSEAIHESGNATDGLADGMDRVGERARAAAQGVMGILAALRASMVELRAQEAVVAAGERAAARGLSENDVRIVQAGAKAEGELAALGVEGPELSAGVAQAQAAERLRLQNEERQRAVFEGFADSGGGGGGGGGRGSAAREQEDYLQNLLLEAQHKQRLVGLTEEQTRRQELLFEMEKRKLPIDEERIAMIVAIEAETRKLLEAEARREQLMQSVESNITSAFMSIVDGSASVEDAFRSMMRNILLAVYEQMVAQPAAAGISNLLSGVFGSLTGGLRTQANGGGWNNGVQFFANGGGWNNGVQFFANGGVVGSPTMFGHSGGIGVMGEAGPEAIMPLKRGADGKLGVSAGGGGSLTVNVVMDPSTGALGAFVQDQAGQVVAKAAPQLAQHAAKSMVDQRRRGGSMKAVFRG